MNTNQVKVVIDVNAVIDLTLEFAGIPTGHRAELEALLHLIGREVIIDDEIVLIQPVISRHIVDVARTVLRRKMNDSQIERVLQVVLRRILVRNGILDDTVEDYRALSQLSWARCGTDTEDEAIVACAERFNAGVITADKELRQYLTARKFPSWSIDEFVSIAQKV